MLSCISHCCGGAKVSPGDQDALRDILSTANDLKSKSQNKAAIQKYEEALQILGERRGQEIKEYKKDIYYNMGVCYQNMGEVAKAIEAHRDALSNGKHLSERHISALEKESL